MIVRFEKDWRLFGAGFDGLTKKQIWGRSYTPLDRYAWFGFFLNCHHRASHRLLHKQWPLLRLGYLRSFTIFISVFLSASSKLVVMMDMNHTRIFSTATGNRCHADFQLPSSLIQWPLVRSSSRSLTMMLGFPSTSFRYFLRCARTTKEHGSTKWMSRETARHMTTKKEKRRLMKTENIS